MMNFMRILSSTVMRPMVVTERLISFSTVSMQATQQLTQVTESAGIRNIQLNNPKTRNALSLEMMTELLAQIKRNKQNEDLRCIVLSANGPSVFSAGHNLKELTNETGGAFHRRVFEMATELMMEMRGSPVPIIAKIDGLAAAAGCQLIAACDLVVCTERSTFSTPGANFGIFCSTPGIAVARSIGQKHAMYMLLTGFPLSAHEALSAGLVSRVVANSESLDIETLRICDAIKAKSRVVVKRGKQFFHEQIQMSLKSAYKYGEQEMIDNLASDDGQEGVRSFIEKRKPNWTHSENNN